MLFWLLRQITLLLLLFMLIIPGILTASRGKVCLCVSLHIQLEYKTEFRFLDVATGSQYMMAHDEFLGRSNRNDDGQASYTYQDKTIALPPEDALILADRSPILSPDSPWLAYLPPTSTASMLNAPSETRTSNTYSQHIYFVLYSFTVGDAVLHEVHLLDTSAGQLRRLFAARYAIASLSWSGDNQHIFALTSNRDILQLNAQTGLLKAQQNIQGVLAPYGNVTNARISINAEWVLFIVGTDNLVLLNLHNGQSTRIDFDVQGVINVIWWEKNRYH